MDLVHSSIPLEGDIMIWYIPPYNIYIGENVYVVHIQQLVLCHIKSHEGVEKVGQSLVPTVEVSWTPA